MGKKYLKFSAISIFVLLLAGGCNKEIEDPSSINATVASDSRQDGNNKGCRLTSIESTFGNTMYTYNKKGLLDTWTAYYLDGHFKHEYNKSGKLIKARLYDAGNTLTTTIQFIYKKNGDVYRELWYDGNTTTIVDDVIHVYDKWGLKTKIVSDFLDYHVSYKYDHFGSLIQWTYYEGESPIVRGEYTYFGRYKNPTGAVPGMDYEYYSTAGVFALNKWYSTSEKYTEWQNGVPVVIEDQDPRKTKMEGNKEGYAIHAEYIDKVNPDPVIFDFTYENCGSCKPHHYKPNKGGNKWDKWKSAKKWRKWKKSTH